MHLRRGDIYLDLDNLVVYQRYISCKNRGYDLWREYFAK